MDLPSNNMVILRFARSNNQKRCFIIDDTWRACPDFFGSMGPWFMSKPMMWWIRFGIASGIFFTVCELEHYHRNSWFTHERWWFSSSQRVSKNQRAQLKHRGPRCLKGDLPTFPYVSAPRMRGVWSLGHLFGKGVKIRQHHGWTRRIPQDRTPI